MIEEWQPTSEKKRQGRGAFLRCAIAAASDLRSGRYPKLCSFCDSAKRCVLRSARVRNREVAEAAVARGLRDRVGAVSGGLEEAYRAEQAVSLIQAAADLSSLVPMEDCSGGRCTIRATLHGHGPYRNVHPGRRYPRVFRGLFRVRDPERARNRQ